MAKRRRSYCLLETLESRTYLSGVAPTSLVSVAANLADGTPTRIYRTPALLQNAVSPANLKASQSSLQSAQAYFDVKFGSPPPVITSDPAAQLDSTQQTTNLSVAALAGTDDFKLTYTWSVLVSPDANLPTFTANGTHDSQDTTAVFHVAGDYAFQVFISDGVQATSATINVHVDSLASRLIVVPGMTQGAIGALRPNGSSTFTALVTDQFGQAVTAPITWSLDNGSIGALSSNGIYQAPGQTGTATVRATFGDLSNSATVTIANGAPVIVTPAATPAQTINGTTANLAVVANDDGDEANLTYAWSLVSGPANAAFSANGTNAAKVTSVSFAKAGTYTFLVTISDGSLTTTSSVTLSVAQKVAAIAVTPANSSLNLKGSTTLTAVACDQFGDLLTVQPTFTWSRTGVGSVSSGLFTAGATAGSAGITASAGGVNGSANVTVTNDSPTIASPAAAPATVSGTSTTLFVLAADDAGENGLTYTWSLLSGPGSPTYTVNGSNAAKTTSVSFSQAGTYTFTVTVSDGALSTSSTVSLTVLPTLSSIVITPGSFSLALNQSLGLTATGYDQFGAALGVQPAITWSKNAGVGAIDANGFYSSGGLIGIASLSASSSGITGSTFATVGNNAPTVAAPANTSTVTATTTAALTVLGDDDGGETNLTYTWSLFASPTGGAASFSSNGTNAAKATTVTFSKAGTYTFLVTLSDGSLTTTSSVTITVAQSLTSITVSPGSSGINLNGSKSLSAVGFDQFGATLTTQPTFTWTKTSGVGGVNSNGLFTASTTAGSAIITASSGAISGSANISIVNAAPTIATPASAPAAVTGTSATLSVLGADDAGENALTYTWALTAGPTGATPTFNVNATNAAKTAVVTFNKAGSYTFLVTVRDGILTVTSSVTLTVAQTLTSIAVTPGSSSVGMNGTKSLSAVAADQFGVTLTTQPTFTWTKTGVGSVNSSGLFTAATTAGSANITATAAGVTGTATVAVTNAAPSVSAPASGPATVTGTTATLNVLGADDAGESGLSYSWTTTAAPTGGTPTFSLNGSNSAKTTLVTFNRAGTYTFTVTLSDGSATITSSVTVTVSQTLATIAVSPGTYSLNTSAVEQFSATGYDQFGVVLASQPAFAWTVDNGGAGSITSGALFTAATSAGAATVRATSGSVSGTAAVTVTGAATGNPVTLTTRNMTSFTELVITGTSSNDTITVSQSGNTFTVVSNGTTQTITGTFGDLAIHAGNGGSTITVSSSVTINNMVYGGGGDDTINDAATANYISLVSIGGGRDRLTGNGSNTCYWVDSQDVVSASAAESYGDFVHRVTQFYQPWTSDPSQPDFISLDLLGQNLRDPSDTGVPVHYPAPYSLFGHVPSMDDIRQNGIGDCYFLATLQALAYTTPTNIYNFVAELGDGSYVVPFMTNFTFSYIRIDGDFSSAAALPGSTGNIWATVMEKAFAFYRIGANTYSSLNAGNPVPVLSSLGLSAYSLSTTFGSESVVASMLSGFVSSHKAVVLLTISAIQGGAPLIGSHAYSLVSVTSDASGHALFTVRNPWGFDGAGADSNPGDGLVTVTFAQLIANMPFGGQVA